MPGEKAIGIVQDAGHEHVAGKINKVPAPEVLAKYNDAFPNGAQHVFNLIKDQSAHRMELEKSVVAARQKLGRLGYIFGFIIGMAGLVVAASCTYAGYDTEGEIIASVDIVGMVGIFVLGKYRQTKGEEK